MPLSLFADAPEPSTVQITVSPAKEGSKISLTCISPAYPPPINYTWYHNKVEISETDKTFQIPNVLVKHAGNYSCLAKNSVGTGKTGQAAELDVQCEYSQSMWVPEGEAVEADTGGRQMSSGDS